MNKGDDTKRRMIEAAADLFHARGIHATSVDEILTASATGKGQMYHYFGGKEDVVHAVMCGHERAFRDALEEDPNPIRTWDDLESWFVRHLENQMSYDFERGCPIGTVAATFHPTQTLVRDDLARIFDLMRAPLVRFFESQQDAGAIRRDADAVSLSTFCIATIQGAMLLGKVEREPAPVLAAIHYALESLRASLTIRRKRPARHK